MVANIKPNIAEIQKINFETTNFPIAEDTAKYPNSGEMNF
jgi:hypothetical protein